VGQDARRFAPATGRNREPIFEVLRRWVKSGAAVLEIASGSGEHAVFLAPRLQVARWQPSDPDPECCLSIDAWRAQSGVREVLPARTLDVTAPLGAAGTADVAEGFDAVFCANMIHIAPWRACEGLLDMSSRVLRPGGILFLYGPFRREGRHTAPSNEAFDASLRARDPEWGIRDLEAVTSSAAERGFEQMAVVAMPANNLSVVFRRQAQT
jgi:cyclopropane fatty-acyl-phospholipid synthase-like methyltransferase